MPADRRGTPRAGGSGAASRPLSRGSCDECHRLKRKCDRQDPCSMCERYGKACKYAQYNARPTREHIVQLQDTSETLRRVIAKYLPDIDLDEAVRRVEEGLDGPSRSPTPQPQRPVSHLRDQKASPHISPHISPHTNPSSHISPHTDTTGERRAAARTVEVFERQPKNAAGYEWNERNLRTPRGHDGTSTLAVDPDGQGYLGFASGATLLRILQFCAGGVSLSDTDSRDPRERERRVREREEYRPSAIELESFIDSYFNNYHLQYPVLHQPTFRAQWANVVPHPPDEQWQLVLNVVLGLGAFCASQPDYVINHFLECAVSSINVDLIEAGSLTLVQGFTILANLAQKMNKPNAAYVYLGIAGRMAVGLGLHRELPFWNISPFEREVRRRVWWYLWVVDAGSSVTFGRPILLTMNECDVNYVVNLHDPSFTPYSTDSPQPVDEITPYANLIFQSQFHVVGGELYNQATSVRPPSSTETLAMDAELGRWQATLPEWIQAAHPSAPGWVGFMRQKLLWRICNLRIILHRRAFLERALTGKPLLPEQQPEEEEEAAEVECARLCLVNARDTIHSVHEFLIQSGRVWTGLEGWYALHYLFHACFVPLIALHTNRASPTVEQWLDDLAKAREVLEAMKAEPLAERFLHILDLLQPHVELPGNADSATVAGADMSWLDALQHSTAWIGSGADTTGGFGPGILPFADLNTLSSLWSGLEGWSGGDGAAGLGPGS